MSEETYQELEFIINHEEIVSAELTREEIIEIYQEIERLNKELQDTKEHLGEYLHEQEEENNRLNNFINELEKYLQNEISNGRSKDNVWLMGCYDEDREILNKLQELRGDKNG